MSDEQEINRSSVWFTAVPDQQRFSSLLQNIECDVAIIGAGIVGLTAAWQLQSSGKSVVVLEKNHLATGDSGQTTGFITRPAEASVHELIGKYGQIFVTRLYQSARQSQKEIIKRIQTFELDCDFLACNSYYGSYRSCDSYLRQEWEALQTVDSEVQWADRPDSTPFAEAIVFAGEGKFHLRKYLFALAEKLSKKNVSIYEETEVLAIETVARGYRLKTQASSVTARAVVIGIGNPTSLFPEFNNLVRENITYVIGVQSETSPIGQSIYWDNEDPYFYYRLFSDKTMIVGGCDVEVEKVKYQQPYELLTQFTQTRFPKHKFNVTHEWSGSIFKSSDSLPYIFEHPYRPGIFVATGLAGVGIVFGNQAGERLANLAFRNANPDSDLFTLKRTNPKISSQPVYQINVFTSRESEYRPVCSLAEFEKKTVVCKLIGDKKIALFKIRDNFYAINNTCSHAGGSLCDGNLDGQVIECPLHAGKFDVTTGQVVSPPPIRPVETYPVRVVNDQLEVYLAASITIEQTANKTKRLTYWQSMMKFSLGALIFWLLHFFYQYQILIPGELGGALVRSFALSGATLISAALFSSAIFKWFPKTAKHWRWRRYLGVSGTVFIVLHILSVSHYLFQWDIAAAFYSLNPIQNPIIFGAVAFPILFVMAATSTDWAVDKLTPQRWKFIHRFVYLAYIASIFHFVLINPALLKNPAGYLLLALTGLAIIGQLYWYIKTVIRRKARNFGTYIGLGLIIGTLTLGYYAVKLKFSGTQTQPIEPVEELLEVSIEKMKAFMKEQPIDKGLKSAPLVEDKAFNGEIIKTGKFQALNYMTSGGVKLMKKDEQYFVVFDESFFTPNGPDLKIYLTKNSDPTGRNDIVHGLQLGSLKSITGKQVYQIPVKTVIQDFHSVSIHCQAFNVPWSYARFE